LKMKISKINLFCSVSIGRFSLKKFKKEKVTGSLYLVPVLK
jgi:hypothetical protein